MRTNFDAVVSSQVRSGKCAGCGKKTTRRVKVEHTVNPFNKTADGRPKTRAEVAADVRAELEAKVKEPLCCSGCEVSRG